MDYERTKGRIKGHRTSRLNSVEFAKKMVPILAQARNEVSDRNGEGHSKLALAKWLNANDYKTIREKIWRSETVFRLLDSHIGWIEEIEKEYEIARGMRDFILKHKEYDKREGRLASLANIEQERAFSIIEARKLAANLKGRDYVDEVVPPPMDPALRQKKPKRPRREKQLKLFTDMPD